MSVRLSPINMFKNAGRWASKTWCWAAGLGRVPKTTMFMGGTGSCLWHWVAHIKKGILYGILPILFWGLSWCRMTRNDSERLGMTRNDSEWLGMTRNDSEWLGTTRNDSERLGMTRNDSEWLGRTRNDSEWLGTTRNDSERLGMTRNDSERLGMTRNGFLNLAQINWFKKLGSLG